MDRNKIMDTKTVFSENIDPPAGLGQELSDMIDSMDAVEKLLSGSRRSAGKSRKYYLSGAAAGIVLSAGLWVAAEMSATPEDTFADPVTAYAETKKILESISDRMKGGLARVADAEEAIDKNVGIIKTLYLP